MVNGYVTMVLKPFTRHNFLKPFFSSCECLLSKDTGNSDSQNDTTEYKKVVLYLLAKVTPAMHFSYTFRNELIDFFEVFRLCTGSLALCAQAHH